MELYDRARAAADYIAEKIKNIPDTAVVLGSGLGAFGDSIKVETEISYADIPYFPVPTVLGHGGVLICGNAGGKRIFAMKGRFHAYEGYSMEDVTLYVRVFALLGVKNFLLTNAAGAINTSFSPGELMLITDHISFFCESPLRGKNDDRFGTRFPPMDRAYSNALCDIARKSANELGITLREGVYAYMKGPMFETGAEIRALALFGADACGMSTVPETVTAVHSGINVLGISLITNMAAGINKEPLSHGEVMGTGKAAELKFKSLMDKICEKLV